MASINYISPNGTSCCIPISTTQQTHPSLAFVDPNGITQYVALSTTLGSGKPHIQYNGVTYSVGQPPAPHVGAIRINATNVEYCCSYNFNTTIQYEACDGTCNKTFIIGLNPTFTSAATATVTYNSKNQTGTSLTIDEILQCLIDRSTTNCWSETKRVWDNANERVEQGCTDSYVRYVINVQDSCYWSASCSYCTTCFSPSGGVSNIPPKCWTDYVSYNLNRTSGTLTIGCLQQCNCCNMTNVPAYSCITYCDPESDYCIGWLKCTPLPQARVYVGGSVPSAVTVRAGAVNCKGYACAHLNAGSSFSTTGGASYNLTGTGYMCWPSCISYTTPEWDISYGSFNVNTSHCCYVMNFNISSSVTGGRWSDGSTTWYPTISGGFSGQCLYGNGTATGCVRATAGTNGGGGAAKGWQNFAAPRVCHAFWS